MTKRAIWKSAVGSGLALALAAFGATSLIGAPAAAPTVSGEDLASGRALGQSRPPNPNEAAPAIPGQNPTGMHVLLWGGLKTHGVGDHDYPQFLADWSKLLTTKGAVVDGVLHAPSATDLEGVAVVVMFKGDAGYLTSAQKTVLDAYVRRGGGFVVIHDSLCGPDPAYMASLVGGAKRHGETNFSSGQMIYRIVDRTSPLMVGVPETPFADEAFHTMTWAPSGVTPLATVAMPGGARAGEVVPQIWSYEHTVAGGQPSRAFVWMQGHAYASIQRPEFTSMLLRGIAWAGKRPVGELVDYQPAGGRGGGGGGAGRAGGAAPATTAAPAGRGP